MPARGVRVSTHGEGTVGLIRLVLRRELRPQVRYLLILRATARVHAKNTSAGRIMSFKLEMPRSSQWPESRRYGMAPAHIPVFLSQEPTTENGMNRPANLF